MLKIMLPVADFFIDTVGCFGDQGKHIYKSVAAGDSKKLQRTGGKPTHSVMLFYNSWILIHSFYI